jgi:hypothetical protein
MIGSGASVRGTAMLSACSIRIGRIIIGAAASWGATDDEGKRSVPQCPGLSYTGLYFEILSLSEKY